MNMNLDLSLLERCVERMEPSLCDSGNFSARSMGAQIRGYCKSNSVNYIYFPRWSSDERYASFDPRRKLCERLTRTSLWQRFQRLGILWHRCRGIPLPRSIQLRLDATTHTVSSRGTQLLCSRQWSWYRNIYEPGHGSAHRVYNAHCAFSYWLEDVYDQRCLGLHHDRIDGLLLG